MAKIVERSAHDNEESVGVVACNVIKRDEKFLLVQEQRTEVYGTWNLPAGHVEKGESLEHAAVREAKEETGYDVKVIKRLAIFQEAAHRNVKHVFLSEVVSGELTVPQGELLDVRWMTLEEVEQLEAQDTLRAPWTADVIRMSQQETA